MEKDPADITYSLLETTLAMSNAIQYLPKFQKFGIDSSVLPFLTDEDLKIIGVDDEHLRSKLIRQCSSLTLMESMSDLTVHQKYLMTVLHELNNHLLMLDASLTYALMRKNIQRCDVKLQKASNCLINCADSLQRELLNFHYIFSPKVSRKNSKWKIAILAVISAAAASTFAFRKYLLY